jgi:hypothetical protein
MPPKPNVPNPALAQIKALGDNFTRLQNDFDTFKEESGKRDKILLEKFRVLTSHNKALRARLDDLEEVCFDTELGGGHASMPVNADEEQSAPEVEIELSEEVKDAERSQEAAESTVVKVSNINKVDEFSLICVHFQALVTRVIGHLMGIGNKLDGKSLFVKARYPFGIDPTSDAWPHEITKEHGEDVKVNLIRFNWALSADDEPNKRSIRSITDFCISNGPSFYTPAAGELSKVRFDDLHQRICTKYTYMKSEYNKVKKREDLAQRQTQAALEALEDEVEEVAERDAAYRSQMKSRVKAVSENSETKGRN